MLNVMPGVAEGITTGGLWEYVLKALPPRCIGGGGGGGMGTAWFWVGVFGEEGDTLGGEESSSIGSTTTLSLRPPDLEPLEEERLRSSSAYRCSRDLESLGSLT